ncbi:MAG: class I SAM-dependent methyltransferase [Nanoarchaeota archaeon]
MPRQNLSEGSKTYHEDAHIYERFSQAEDHPRMILDYLLPSTKGKSVLDLGCGTGKYMAHLASSASRYVCLDISSEQLRIARTRAEGNVEFLCSSAESIALPDESMDIIISTWVLGTIVDKDRRSAALREAQRVLKKQGSIYLVENDVGGDFERIRGRYPDTTRTKRYNEWLEMHDFQAVKRFTTYFQFHDVDEAKRIFGSIWGRDVADRTKDAKIMHNIIIYQQIKR